MTPEELARSSWQSSGSTNALPPIEELLSKASKFRSRIRRRNIVEYISGVFVVAVFGWMLIFGPLPTTPSVIPELTIRLGSAMIIVGTLVALWQLHRRTAPLSTPEHAGQQSVLDYQRSELARQRDALDSVFTWYLLPLLPGLLVFLAGPLAMSPEIGQWSWFKVVLKVCLVPLVFVGVWWLNKVGARKLQGKIDEIDALRRE